MRGTLSFEDILTDLSADCEDLTLEDVLENGFVHKGITQAANYIYQKLINDGILNQAFTIAPVSHLPNDLVCQKSCASSSVFQSSLSVCRNTNL